MSMNSDNPFQSSRNNTTEPQPKKRNVWVWVLGTLGVLGVVGALVCCGGSYFMFQFGQNMMGDQIKKQVGDDPIIVEHIGEIESAKMSFTETASAADGQKPDPIAFDVVGDKGSAVLVIRPDNNAPGQPFSFRSAELILPDGSRHQLVSGDDAGDLPSSVDATAPEPADEFQTIDIEQLQPLNN
ncbi:hypothetical protein CA13_07800 [Planctomycetes bacterium CA13]|uniref:Cytochrome oxidase complex assembly protein 1 n=1 Tax=Novipirellula herctigrandis TaxID=2527986 RepID=A0A5C5YWX5_9BACT|nr:hypothetical protein CA13_07800 [Planctomycetes bacterium CA13]